MGQSLRSETLCFLKKCTIFEVFEGLITQTHVFVKTPFRSFSLVKQQKRTSSERVGTEIWVSFLLRGQKGGASEKPIEATVLAI